ncbi:UNVERIFIED_CONTAM: two-component sensor histidine kinase, partial [Salmonella enterica subsp. enterica serovar Weltevreden]
VSLAREIAHTVEYLDVLLDDAGVRVRIDGDARTTVETALLGRAMTNLLINAVQHSERGTEIVAEIAPATDGVRVSVRNAGPQIEPH